METNEIKNKLWPEDYELFAKMEGHYVSENEKIFFETLRHKMEYRSTLMYELLFDVEENEDSLYFLRFDYHEFIVGRGDSLTFKKPEHTMGLWEALQVDLSPWLYGKNITFFEWLRQHDYSMMNYNRENWL